MVLLSVALNSLTAWDAVNLLPQVPLQTEIVKGVIVAPHKEAFKRTMSIMHYANLRILEKLCTRQEFQMDPFTTVTCYGLYYAGCWAFGWYFFGPSKSDVRNGNTWIFVMPMFVAVITDIPAQLAVLLLQQQPEQQPEQQQQQNYGALQLEHYLLIELSALIIAFGFTLAFRGYMSVRQIYFGSAVYVAGLFGMVTRTILFQQHKMATTLDDNFQPQTLQ